MVAKENNFLLYCKLFYYCNFEVLEKACSEYNQVSIQEIADDQTVETVALSILQRYAIAFEKMARVS